MATVLLHPEVEKKLESLPADIETRIRSKLVDAGSSPGRHLKPLIRTAVIRYRRSDTRPVVQAVTHQICEALQKMVIAVRMKGREEYSLRIGNGELLSTGTAIKTNSGY